MKLLAVKLARYFLNKKKHLSGNPERSFGNRWIFAFEDPKRTVWGRGREA